MVAYVVHDTGTGEVVHVHVEPAELGSSPEEVVRLVAGRSARPLTALRVPAPEIAAGGRVVDGELRAADTQDWGWGAVEGGLDPGVAPEYRAER